MRIDELLGLYQEVLIRHDKFLKNSYTSQTAGLSPAYDLLLDSYSEASHAFVNSIKELEAKNTQLKEAMRLIPVTERMPEDHQEVLIYREGNFDTAMYHKSLPILNDDNEFVNMEGFDAGWCVYSRSKYGDFPTHWQALPEQPKEKE